MSWATDSDIPDNATLRRRFRRARRAVSALAQREHADAVARHFFTTPLSWRTGCVAAYLPFDGELNPLPLLRRLAARDQVVALPIIQGTRLTFHRWHPGDRLRQNRYGIGEPDPSTQRIDPRAIAMTLTPLVAFDHTGTRLGMGAGFYDRHLGALPQRLRPRVIGLAHACQQADTLTRASWDVPLDAVITEHGCLCFAV